MKILYAYRDAGSTWGINRVIRSLGGTMAHMGARQLLQVAQSNSHDVIIIDQSLAKQTLQELPGVGLRLRECKQPLVMYETVDGSQLGLREVLTWPSVKATLKRSVLHPSELNNQVYGRYHIGILYRAGIVAKRSMWTDRKPMPQLSKTELAKIHPLVGFGAHSQLDSIVKQPIDFSRSRHLDVHYAGTVAYNGSEVEVHRHQAWQVTHEWKMKHRGKAIAGAGRMLRKGKYRATIRDSRTVLSPWGWGETTHRDFEAMLLGAVVIKPDMSHVKTWPDLFVPDETYLPCKPDFSDASAKIKQVVDNWSDFLLMRKRARALAIKAHQPEGLALRLKEILEVIL